MKTEISNGTPEIILTSQIRIKLTRIPTFGPNVPFSTMFHCKAYPPSPNSIGAALLLSLTPCSFKHTTLCKPFVLPLKLLQNSLNANIHSNMALFLMYETNDKSVSGMGDKIHRAHREILSKKTIILRELCAWHGFAHL